MALDAALIYSPGPGASLAAGCEKHGLKSVLIHESEGGRADQIAVAIDAAIHRVGLSPAQCVLITDHPDAAHAARSAGLVTLAICSRQYDRAALHAAGARLAYDNAEHLLR